MVKQLVEMGSEMISKELEMRDCSAETISKDSIEAAYCFFHQKHRVYAFSSDARQREDIEYAVESYVDTMSPALYAQISHGNPRFLRDYAVFQQDVEQAIAELEGMM